MRAENEMLHRNVVLSQAADGTRLPEGEILVNTMLTYKLCKITCLWLKVSNSFLSNFVLIKSQPKVLEDPIFSSCLKNCIQILNVYAQDSKTYKSAIIL